MSKKYELLRDNFKPLTETRKLFRIRALRDFGDIKAGTVGGYVESEANLQQEGTCWVAENAQVYGEAEVWSDAVVSGECWIFGDCSIGGNTQVFGDARVGGNAEVFGTVGGYASVFGNTKVEEGAKVTGYSEFTGNVVVGGGVPRRFWNLLWGIFQDLQVSGDPKTNYTKVKASWFAETPTGDTITVWKDDDGEIRTSIFGHVKYLELYQQLAYKALGEIE